MTAPYALLIFAGVLALFGLWQSAVGGTKVWLSRLLVLSH